MISIWTLNAFLVQIEEVGEGRSIQGELQGQSYATGLAKQTFEGPRARAQKEAIDHMCKY